jgi:hypothetical protein
MCAFSLVRGTRVGIGIGIGHYPTGISYSDKDIAALPLVRHDFHGDPATSRHAIATGRYFFADP